MKESKLYKGLLATLIVAALAAPAIASADANGELKGVSVKVSYADLNLEKQEGAKALYRRLQQASRRACDIHGANIRKSVTTMREARQCFNETLSDAVAEVDNELVTAIHNS